MNLETAIEQFELINEAIASVTRCAKQSQKISHNKHIEDKYTSALFQLELYRTSAQVYLTRAKTIGK